jgi:hypothetical protein
MGTSFDGCLLVHLTICHHCLYLPLCLPRSSQEQEIIAPFAAALTAVDTISTVEIDTDGDGVTDFTAYSEEYKVTLGYPELIQALKGLNVRGSKMLVFKVKLSQYFEAKGRHNLALVSLGSVERILRYRSSEQCPKNWCIDKQAATYIIGIIDVLNQSLLARKRSH